MPLWRMEPRATGPYGAYEGGSWVPIFLSWNNSNLCSTEWFLKGALVQETLNLPHFDHGNGSSDLMPQCLGSLQLLPAPSTSGKTTNNILPRFSPSLVSWNSDPQQIFGPWRLLSWLPPSKRSTWWPRWLPRSPPPQPLPRVAFPAVVQPLRPQWRVPWWREAWEDKGARWSRTNWPRSSVRPPPWISWRRSQAMGWDGWMIFGEWKSCRVEFSGWFVESRGFGVWSSSSC